MSRDFILIAPRASCVPLSSSETHHLNLEFSGSGSSEDVADSTTKAVKSPALVESTDNGVKNEADEAPKSVLGNVKVRVEHW